MPDSRVSARALDHMLGEWRGGGTAYRALADAIRVLCLDRRLVAGTALPAERELAHALGVSRTTVAAAYRSLRDSGDIASVRGSGSVVRGSSSTPSAAGSGRSPAAGDEIDLQQASPSAWPGLAELYAAITHDLVQIVRRPGYDIVGALPLREAIAEKYTRAGLDTSPDQVIVTTGAQNAISLLAGTMVRRGDRVAIETPTYPHAAEALRRAGGRLVPIPVDPRVGWDTERAEDVIRRGAPTAAYLMPDFQNPTGRTMPQEERALLMESALTGGTTLLIDETTAELDIDRNTPWVPFGVGFDHHSLRQVVTIGSLGKTVWGGLRIGWIRADEDVIQRVLARRSAFDLGTPEIEQRVALGALERMDEILLQRRRYLGAGRDAVTEALLTKLPEWDVPHVPGGVALWVGIGAPVSSRLVLAARARGVLLSSGTRFGVDGGHERRLRIPFTTDPASLHRAVEVLREAWSEVSAVHGLGRERPVAVV